MLKLKSMTDKEYFAQLDPERLKPIDPEDFAFAFQLSNAAASYRMPMKSPAQYGIDIEDSDGDVARYSPKDIPANRAAFAVLEHWNGDRNKFHSFMWRMDALSDVMESSEIAPWTREEDGRRTLHPAIIEVAASMTVNEVGKFDIGEFVKRVDTVAKRIEVEFETKS